MTSLTIGGLALLAGLVAAGLTLLARRFVPGLDRMETESWARALGYVAATYGVIVGFSIVFLFGEFSDAVDAVGDEAAALRSGFEDTWLLGDDPSGVQHTLICYSRALPQHEWPALARGELATEVDDAYRDVFLALDALEIEETESESAALKSVVGSLEQAAFARATRRVAANTEIPTLLGVILFAGGALVVVLIFVVSLGAPPAKQAFLVGTVTVFTAILIGLVYQLGQPFRDDGGGVTPEIIEEATTVMERAAPDVGAIPCPVGR